MPGNPLGKGEVESSILSGSTKETSLSRHYRGFSVFHAMLRQTIPTEERPRNIRQNQCEIRARGR